jgi:amino acid permease
MKKIQRQSEVALHALVIAALLTISIRLVTQNMLFPALIIGCLSATAIAVTLFWKPFKIKPKQARLASFYLECPALLLCRFMFGQQHETNMAQLYLLAGIALPAFGYLTSIKPKKIKKRAA